MADAAHCRESVMSICVCEKELLQAVSPDARSEVEEALAATALHEARQEFHKWLTRYTEAELARPMQELVANHEFGGNFRPLFAAARINDDRKIIDRAMELFRMRRHWVKENLYHGFVDCAEVHHEPETFLYFQIPFLEATEDRDVLAAVEHVAEHAGNWADGVPDWYDWQAHEFRSTCLGTRDVRAYHPHDYQEANHWRIIAIALASYRHGAGDRYLKLALDYAGRWMRHFEECIETGVPTGMSILPEGATRIELGYGGKLKKEPAAGEYCIFYLHIAPNTSYELMQGMQDLFRLTGDERYLDTAGMILKQFIEHGDQDTGRWASGLSGDTWRVHSEYTGERPALVTAGALTIRAAMRQLALRPDAAVQQALLKYAEAVLEGDDPFDVSMTRLLFGANMITGREEFAVAGYRRLAACAAAAHNAPGWHCCSPLTRPGHGSALEGALQLEEGLVDGGTRGSWPLAWPHSSA